jgi:hypothetical protein
MRVHVRAYARGNSHSIGDTVVQQVMRLEKSMLLKVGAHNTHTRAQITLKKTSTSLRFDFEPPTYVELLCVTIAAVLSVSALSLRFDFEPPTYVELLCVTIAAVLSVSALLRAVSAAVSSTLTLISSKDFTAGVTTLSGNMPDGGFVVACGERWC